MPTIELHFDVEPARDALPPGALIEPHDGAFAWAVTVELPAPVLESASALCQTLGLVALTSDDTVNPFRWIRIAADGVRTIVSVDIEAWDEGRLTAAGIGPFIAEEPPESSPPRPAPRRQAPSTPHGRWRDTLDGPRGYRIEGRLNFELAAKLDENAHDAIGALIDATNALDRATADRWPTEAERAELRRLIAAVRAVVPADACDRMHDGVAGVHIHYASYFLGED